ncbi:MAG: hypothetical protein ACK56F_18195, partial [bacterium]
DRAGRVKAEVQEVVKAGDHLEVDNTAKADALTACDTSGTEDRYRVDTSQMSTPFPIPGLHWHDPHSDFARKEKKNFRQIHASESRKEHQVVRKESLSV